MCKHLHLQTVEQSPNNVPHCDLQKIISSTSSQILEESLCAGSTLGWNQCIRNTCRHQRIWAARRAAHTCRLQLHHSEKKPHDGETVSSGPKLIWGQREPRAHICLELLSHVFTSMSLIQDLFTAPPTWTTPTSAFINIRAQNSASWSQNQPVVFRFPQCRLLWHLDDNSLLCVTFPRTQPAITTVCSSVVKRN